MKRFLVSILLAAAAFNAGATVKTGLEVLVESDFAVLKGKRVGLVTNPTGVDRNLRSTVDILNDAPEVSLVALFGPEHGVRGDIAAGGYVAQTTDRKTGLPIYSLYGSTRKPAAGMLRGLDAVVYDIQDNGCRSYTFISTLGLMMQACAEQGVEVIVLDRPNPLGGRKVEGCFVEPGYFSFVSMYRIPYIYGLTVGELATMLNEEGMVRGQQGNETPRKCKLTVVEMEGWERDMTFDDTGLPWVPTSPNIPHTKTAYCYPASGIIGELGGYLNIGVGYTLPFECFAATWITDAEAFARALNGLGLDGVEFRPAYYQPFSGSSAGKTVAGVQIFFTDYSAARLTEIQFHVMEVVARMFPSQRPLDSTDASKFSMFDKVLGTNRIREALKKNYRFEDIKEYWRKDEASFRSASQKYYIYRDKL